MHHHALLRLEGTIALTNKLRCRSVSLTSFNHSHCITLPAQRHQFRHAAGDKSPATLAWMILPAVLVCLWTCVVGASMARMYYELRSADLGFNSLAGPMGDVAGRWLWVCALVELLSNAGPPWVTALSGNAGEVVLLAGFVAAERELTSQSFMP
jgi:hypothetical protein